MAVSNIWDNVMQPKQQLRTWEAVVVEEAGATATRDGGQSQNASASPSPTSPSSIQATWAKERQRLHALHAQVLDHALDNFWAWDDTILDTNKSGEKPDTMGDATKRLRWWHASATDHSKSATLPKEGHAYLPKHTDVDQVYRRPDGELIYFEHFRSHDASSRLAIAVVLRTGNWAFWRHFSIDGHKADHKTTVAWAAPSGGFVMRDGGRLSKFSTVDHPTKTLMRPLAHRQMSRSGPIAATKDFVFAANQWSSGMAVNPSIQVLRAQDLRMLGEFTMPRGTRVTEMCVGHDERVYVLSREGDVSSFAIQDVRNETCGVWWTLHRWWQGAV